MANFLQDLHYGIRMLRRSPGFALVAVLTLALGIGANTAIFSVVHAVLLKSLPYPDPDRLLAVDEYGVHGGQEMVSWMDFLDWRQQTRSFQDMGVYRANDLVLTRAGGPEMIRAGQISASIFPLLGTNLMLGRLFSPDDDKPSANPTAILSYAFWRNRFGGDPGIVGKNVTLNDKSYDVVGILSPEFSFFPQRIDLYLPIGLEGAEKSMLERGNHQDLHALARLRLGISISAARSEMDGVTKRLETQYPETNSGQRVKLTRFYESRFSEFQPALFTLLGAVGCVLLIACVNVANLSLARAAARQKEFAIRAAIGARRIRVICQLLTESVLLAMLGGLLGSVIAMWSIGPLLRIAPQSIPRLADTRVDAGVFLFTFGIALLTGILFGLAPAFYASRGDVNPSLREGGGTATPGRSRQRLRAALLIAEVSLAVVLVIASGLLIRSLAKAVAVDPGFRADHMLAFDVGLPRTRYGTNPQQIAFLAQALGSIRNLPGVQSASAALCPPLVGTCRDSIFIFDDRPVPPIPELPRAAFNVIDTEYFHTMQVPLIVGRLFTPTDREDTVPVILINETAARRWWPRESAIGKRIKQGFPNDKTPYCEVVGVIGDLHQDGPDQPEWPEVFEPAAQNPSSDWTFVVRTKTEPMALAGAVADAIHSVDKDQPLYHVQTMAEYFAKSLASRKFLTLLLGLFGGLALLLAAVGIYGVVAYTVTQRTHEIGIRMALGAQARDLFGMVVKFGFRLAIAGIALGLVVSLAVARLMRGLLFGVNNWDATTFAGVVGLLCAVVFAACYIPARRAMRVDPIIALRYE